MSFWRLFYHLVWGTKGRVALIDDERAAIIEDSFRATCRQSGAILHALGIMPEHVHVAVSIPPRIAVAEFVMLLKGASSRRLNQATTSQERGQFRWQPEYGVLSFGDRSLDQVIAYVRQQRKHHAEGSVLPWYEIPEKPFHRDGSMPASRDSTQETHHDILSKRLAPELPPGPEERERP